jgi:TolB-like protein/lipoprotein NlpI
MPDSRQLVAILFADITGFTAMMQQDEALALVSRQKLQDILEKEVVKHNGRIIEFKGDGVLCSFVSSIECVHASVSLQQQMQTAPVVPLRIGIHTGDVLFNDNNIYGDGVNIASRLESFAVPGSIFISGKVYDDIKNQKEFQTASLGLYHFKNVREQVEIFCISNPGLVVPSGNYLEGKGEKVPAKSEEKSIAVLPFLNLSNDPEQEYFSDGIAEEILGSLSQLKDLKVAGRSSSFQFKGRNVDLAEVGDKLHVETVLEGSVRKQDKRIRVSAQLVNVKDGFHLWSEKFDRDLDDIFAIQDEIALAITEKLKLTLLHQEKQLLFKPPTNNKAAYDLYLKGRFFWNKRGPGLQKGLQYFIQATVMDEQFALAHTGIADTYALLAFYAMLPPDEAIPKALDAAGKAIKTDPLRVEPYSVAAFVTMFYNWNWTQAKKEFEKVFAMNPRYAPAHYWYSQYLCWIERDYNGAIEEARYAIELEPLVSHSHHLLAFVQYNYDHFEEALEASNMAIELDPNSFLAYSSLGMSLYGLNKYEEAVKALLRSAALSARHQYPLLQLFYIYSLNGDQVAAADIADELRKRSEKEYISAAGLSMVAYTLKEYDKAIEYMERAFTEHDNVLTWINVSSIFSFVKADERFRPYLERMHFLG